MLDFSEYQHNLLGSRLVLIRHDIVPLGGGGEGCEEREGYTVIYCAHGPVSGTCMRKTVTTTNISDLVE